MSETGGRGYGSARCGRYGCQGLPQMHSLLFQRSNQGHVTAVNSVIRHAALLLLQAAVKAAAELPAAHAGLQPLVDLFVIVCSSNALRLG